jgi:hypothetical protein
MPLITGPNTNRLETLAKRAKDPRDLVLVAVEMIEHAERRIMKDKPFATLPEAREILRITHDWLGGKDVTVARQDAVRHAERGIRTENKATGSHYEATRQVAWMVEACIAGLEPEGISKRLIYVAWEARRAIGYAGKLDWVEEGQWQVEHLESLVLDCAQDARFGPRLRTSTLAA